MINSSLVKVSDKLNADHNQELKSLWAADKDRPPIYSRDQFKQFWDITVVEHRATK